MILDQLVFTELFHWFAKKRAYKSAHVAEKILQIYNTLFVIWKNAALLFPEEELSFPSTTVKWPSQTHKQIKRARKFDCLKQPWNIYWSIEYWYGYFFDHWSLVCESKFGILKNAEDERPNVELPLISAIIRAKTNLTPLSDSDWWTWKELTHQAVKDQQSNPKIFTSTLNNRIIGSCHDSTSLWRINW